MPTVTQEQVDRVAAFVEVADDAAREPFFSIQDKFVNFQGDEKCARATYFLGDRFEFRSALIPFQRMWSKNDPAHWETASRILGESGLPTTLVLVTKDAGNQVQWTLDRQDFPGAVKLTPRRVVELWLNSVGTPDAIDGAKLRAEFDTLCEQHGHAAFEFAFRSSVQWIGYNLLGLYQNAARPALDVYRDRYGITPSFRLEAPFRFRRREQTPSGYMLIREATSEAAPEETYEERFARLLERQENRNVNQIFGHLEASRGDLIRAVLRAKDFGELLSLLEGHFEVAELPKGKVGGPRHDSFVSAGWIVSQTVPAQRYNMYDRNVVMTNEAGIAALHNSLAQFRRQLVDE
ncbi:MAG: hypothetical protein WC378_04355 [Opitutaceae bacterium]|jgi:hypothetical protein